MRIFVVDVGNSFIKMQAFESEISIGMWQFETYGNLSEENIIEEIESNFLQLKITKNNFKGIVLCSVVPEITPIVHKALNKFFKNKYILNVTSQTKTGLSILDENSRIGADRIANMVGAAKIYGAPAIVVSMGTATVFTAMDDNMRVLGGQIIAGGDLSLQSLLKRSTNISKILTVSDEVIARIKTTPTDIIIGKNTEENIRAGSFWGLASQVEGISSLIKRELVKRIGTSSNIKVIATGGLSNLFKDFKFSNVDFVDPDLTRKGLRIIGEMNFPA